MLDLEKNKTIFKVLKGGFDSNFTYIIGCPETKKLALIDCSVEAYKISQTLNEMGDYKLDKILITHSHFDHINSLKKIISDFPETKIYAHVLATNNIRKQCNLTIDFELQDNEIINLGNEKIRAIYTPGHQPDCVCFLWQNKLFTGDTLFVESTGRWDFPESNPREHFESLKYLRGLDDNIEIYSGHDYGSKESSNIAYEKLYNPYFKN